jgi:hypothetical protein
MQSEEASSLQPTPLPASSGERSDLRTVVAVAMVAYAACSVVHELVGHGSGCLLTGAKPVLVTSILLQSAGGNRIVDVGGPVANILFGAGAFYWFERQAKFTAFSYTPSGSLPLSISWWRLATSSIRGSRTGATGHRPSGNCTRNTHGGLRSAWEAFCSISWLSGFCAGL